MFKGHIGYRLDTAVPIFGLAESCPTPRSALERTYNRDYVRGGCLPHRFPPYGAENHAAPVGIFVLSTCSDQPHATNCTPCIVVEVAISR